MTCAWTPSLSMACLRHPPQSSHQINSTPGTIAPFVPSKSKFFPLPRKATTTTSLFTVSGAPLSVKIETFGGSWLYKSH